MAVEWGVHEWPVVMGTSLPEQMDSGSCGVFVLAVADCIAAGESAAFSQEHIPVLRARVAMALFVDDLTALGAADVPQRVG